MSGSINTNGTDISETGTTLTGTIDGVDYSGAQTGTLDVGAHTIVATIHKPGFTDHTTTRKIMVVKKLDEPAYTFTGTTYGNTDTNGFDYYEVDTATDTLPYTIVIRCFCCRQGWLHNKLGKRNDYYEQFGQCFD